MCCNVSVLRSRTFTEFFQVDLAQIGPLLERGTLHTYIKPPK